MSISSTFENLLEQGEQLLLGQRSREASTLAHSILAGMGEDPRALHFAGLAAAVDKDFCRAIECLARAVELEPHCASWWADLATVLFAESRLDEAEQRSLRALALDWNCAVAHDLLAQTAARRAEDFRAHQHIQVLASLRPGDPKVLSRLALAEYAVGNVPEALRHMRKLISQGLASPYLHSEYVSALLYDAGQTRASLRQAFAEWAALFRVRAPHRVSSRRRRLGRKLRIGYLTGEFAATPSQYFLLPIFRHHDHRRFEITGYHTRDIDDALSAQYCDLFDHWCDCSNMSDEDLAGRIQADEIDILVDLSCHLRCHRLEVFALQPAPVQVSYPNYPASTGVTGVQYIFTDRWICPPGHESQYTEEVHHLSHGYLVYGPPEDAPAVAELPCDHNSDLVFGLFQRPAKLNAGVWDLVAQVVAACSGSKLLVHYSSVELDQPESPARGFVERELTARGIAPARILYRGWLPTEQHLELVGQVDLALDTFPYNGTTTTCECLWMGVPVVTLAGGTHSSRVGYQLLDRAGLADLVASTPEEFQQITVTLAQDRRRLRKLRRSLRDRLRQSTLLNPRPLVREMEAAYLAMWKRYLEEHP
jgi:protein O-GlcNAc transferase